jgi:hypothetical protein
MEIGAPDDNMLPAKNRSRAGPHARYDGICHNTDTKCNFAQQPFRRFHTYMHVCIGDADGETAQKQHVRHSNSLRNAIWNCTHAARTERITADTHGALQALRALARRRLSQGRQASARAARLIAAFMAHHTARLGGVYVRLA